MNIDKYEIYIPSITGPVSIAYGMDLSDALIFLEALMLKHYNEPGLAYAIRKEERSECNATCGC